MVIFSSSLCWITRGYSTRWPGGIVPKTRPMAHFRAKTPRKSQKWLRRSDQRSVNLALLLMETPSLLIEKHSLIRWICSRLLVFHGKKHLRKLYYIINYWYQSDVYTCHRLKLSQTQVAFLEINLNIKALKTVVLFQFGLFTWTQLSHPKDWMVQISKWQHSCHCRGSIVPQH